MAGTSPPPAASSPSLVLALRHILDRLAVEDSFSPTQQPPYKQLGLPGKRTPELQALEVSLHALVGRIQDLEAQRYSSDVTPTPSNHSLTSIEEDDGVLGAVCDSCGHRLENVPLTPEETPPVVDSDGPHVPRRIPSSTNPQRYCVVVAKRLTGLCV
jgi:hypothetical protein